MIVRLLSRVRLFVTLWTVGHKASPSMGFPRQEYWSGLPFPFPGNLPDPGIEPGSPSLQADALTSEPNAYKGLYRDLDVEAFHPLPLPQPGPGGSNILPGCGQTAKTLTFLWFHLSKASLEVQDFIQFFKRRAPKLTSFTVAFHRHKIRPASLQLGLLIFQVPVIYACCPSTTVSLHGNSSC